MGFKPIPLPIPLPIKRFRLCCSVCGPLTSALTIYRGDSMPLEFAEVNHFLERGCRGRISAGEPMPLFAATVRPGRSFTPGYPVKVPMPSADPASRRAPVCK